MNSGDSSVLLIIVICIMMSAYFSATETAFSSLSRIRIKNMADHGDRRAALVLQLSEKYDQMLSTILIGNNIVNILTASLATMLFVRQFGDVGASLSTLVTTVVVLIFGEISPKSLAKESPESFAKLSAPFLRVLMIVLTPLNFLFVLWKRLLSLVFKTKDESGITEEELLTIVEEAESTGGLDAEEGELIRSAIEFSDLEAVDIFTPRVSIIAVPHDADRETIGAQFAETGFSRLPVYEGSIDNIVGILHEKDFFAKVLRAGEPLSAAVKPAVFIPRNMKIDELLRLLQKTKSHMAVVADEFGGTVGIVTLEDVLEELVGEIWDEHDEIVEPFTKVSENQYHVLCSADPDELFELLEIDYEPSEFSTVNGWVLGEMGHIPHAGESFRWRNLEVSIEKADSRRVLEVLITVHPEEPDET